MTVTDNQVRLAHEAFYNCKDATTSEWAMRKALEAAYAAEEPEKQRITCEGCGRLHIDEGAFATKPHHTHSCQHCGLTWRPSIKPKFGVQFLPGFKNDAPDLTRPTARAESALDLPIKYQRNNGGVKTLSWDTRKEERRKCKPWPTPHRFPWDERNDGGRTYGFDRRVSPKGEI